MGGMQKLCIRTNVSQGKKAWLAKIHYDITFIVIQETFVISLLSKAVLFTAWVEGKGKSIFYSCVWAAKVVRVAQKRKKKEKEKAGNEMENSNVTA